MGAYNAGGPRSSTLEANGDFAYSDPVANPGALGAQVIMNPFSGPQGSPMDALEYPSDTYQPEPDDREVNTLDTSTGGMSTGIGFGLNASSPGIAELFSATDPRKSGNFTDNVIPGVTMPDGSTAATLATLLAIGGGRSEVVPHEDDDATDFSRALSEPDPYTAVPVYAFGGGVLRDAGAGPEFTGFGMKVVTAAGDVADAAVIETGFKNYQGAVLKTGFSQFGSNVAAATAPTLAEAEPAKTPAAKQVVEDEKSAEARYQTLKAEAAKPVPPKPAAPAPSKAAPAPTKK